VLAACRAHAPEPSPVTVAVAAAPARADDDAELIAHDVPADDAHHAFRAERTTRDGLCTWQVTITYDEVRSVRTCPGDPTALTGGYALRRVALSAFVVPEPSGLSHAAVAHELYSLRLVDCFEGFGTRDVELRGAILSGGAIVDGAVAGAPDPATKSCIERLLRSARFPAGRDQLPTAFTVHARFEGIDPRTVATDDYANPRARL
jgi:hypothetical protein